MRFVLIAAALSLLTGCSEPPAPAPPHDQTTDAWYGETVRQLSTMTATANDLFHRGKRDDAAALIEKGEPLASRLLTVLHPTLGATEAASDLDDLYGRMLLSSRNYGWARLQFQKNLARWKYWKPQTPESAERLKQAQAEIEECDTKMTQ